MELKVTPENLHIRLNIQAVCLTAIPLPVSSKSWTPDSVLLDQEPIKGLAKDSEGILWALVPEGIHTIALIGKTGVRNSIQIPFVLKPHRAVVSSAEWDVQGVHPDGSVAASIQLT